jgi:hypothetical protein
MRYILLIVAFELFFSASLFAQTASSPAQMIMSYPGGEIVKVDLATWQVHKYPVKVSARYYSEANLKYFSCCNKVVFFVGGEGENLLGVIDLADDSVKYINPIDHGLRKKIENIFLSSSRGEILYITTNDQMYQEVDFSDKEKGVAFSKSYMYGMHDVSADAWTVVDIPPAEEQAPFPYVFRDEQKTRNHNMQTTLSQRKILGGTGSKDKVINVLGKFTIARKENSLAIITQNSSGEFSIVKSSPPSFANKHRGLLNTESAILITK